MRSLQLPYCDHISSRNLGFTMLLPSQAISIAFHSERKKSDKFCSDSNFSLRFFYMPQTYDTGPMALLPFQRKSNSGFLRSEKINQSWPGLNPRTSDPVASMISTGPSGSTRISKYYHKGLLDHPSNFHCNQHDLTQTIPL